MKRSLPNILTLSRGALTFLILLLFFASFSEKYPLLLILFFLASITDFFDGYLARKWNVISDFGMVFDSLIDKVLVLSVFVLLAPLNILPLWMIAILVVRDLLVDGMKNILLSRGKPVASFPTGKWKFFFQILAIHAVFLALSIPEAESLTHIAFFLGMIALFFALLSGAFYVRLFFREFAFRL